MIICMNAKIYSGKLPYREQQDGKEKKEDRQTHWKTLRRGYCILENDAETILENAISKFGLSHRSIYCISEKGCSNHSDPQGA